MKKFAVIGVVLALAVAAAGCKKKTPKKAAKPSVTQTQKDTTKMKAQKDTTMIKDTTKSQDTTAVKDTLKAKKNNNQNKPKTGNTANKKSEAPKKKIKKKIR